jgi:hypothetical protein
MDKVIDGSWNFRKKKILNLCACARKLRNTRAPYCVSRTSSSASTLAVVALNEADVRTVTRPASVWAPDSLPIGVGEEGRRLAQQLSETNHLDLGFDTPYTGGSLRIRFHTWASRLIGKTILHNIDAIDKGLAESPTKRKNCAVTSNLGVLCLSTCENCRRWCPSNLGCIALGGEAHDRSQRDQKHAFWLP